MQGRACPVYVHLNSGEKAALERLAKSTDRSVSSCVRDIIAPYIADYFPEGKSAVTISEDDLIEPLYGEGLVGFGSSKKKNVVRIYLSDVELSYLKRCAKRVRLSAYIRKIIFAGPSRFQIDVATDDVNELLDKIDSSVGYIREVLAQVEWKKYVLPKDLRRLLKLTEAVQFEVQTTLKEVCDNRQSIRRRGKKILERRISELLKNAELDVKNQNSNSENGN